LYCLAQPYVFSSIKWTRWSIFSIKDIVRYKGALGTWGHTTNVSSEGHEWHTAQHWW
jgi:hypothetical protein